MTMLGTLSVALNLQDVRAGDLDAATISLLKTFGWDIAGGTGGNQADVAFSDERTLAASGTEDLDLSGALSSLFGSGVFAKVKAIVVYALPANTNDVQVTRPASNGAPLFLAAGDGVAIGPGGFFALTRPKTGFTVTAGTADLVTVTNSSGTTAVTYRVIFIGTSA